MKSRENALKVRPRFQEKVNLPPEEVKRRILLGLQKNSSRWSGKIVDNHVILKIPDPEQHYWSPQLTLEVEENNGNTLIRGLFGPKPGVWTMFVFFYSAIGFLTLMGLIFGLSQLLLNMEAYGLWAVPIGIFLLTGLFIMSKIGQRLGLDQMNKLHELLKDAVALPMDTN